jgi:glutamine synthetase
MPRLRLENRIGRPSANPYLYILSQIVAGLDGVERSLDPGPGRRAWRGPADAAGEPAGGTRHTRARRLFRTQLGDVFVDYFLKLKRNEAGQFAQWLGDTGTAPGDEPTHRAERVFRFLLRRWYASPAETKRGR